MVTPVTDWSDFDYFVTRYVPLQTIATLKIFANELETATGVWLGIKSNDRKTILVSKIEHGFRDMRARNDLEVYRRVRANCETYAGPAIKPSVMPPQPTFGGVHVPRYPSGGSSSFHDPSAAPLPPSRYNPASTSSYRPNGHASTSANGSSSGWGQSHGVNNVYQQRGSGPNHALMDWKPNPMYKPIRAVTAMEQLPDIDGDQKSHTRREKRLIFMLPNDVLDKLRASQMGNTQSHYSLRLFCASSDHYKPPSAPYSVSTANIRNVAIPIEFPINPDVSIDYQALLFKQKGLRGKPGSAPPFDLGSSPNGLNLTPNRMMNVNVGHTGPTTGKKKENWKRFWFQVALTEMTTKDELLSRLLQMNPLSAEESLAQARQRNNDDDIEVGTVPMSLKDPLSYMRITRPVRSSKCSHIQCFDATWWIESNVQHPQWLCPLCNKELRFDDLIVDGYFLGILNSVPESVDEVLVDPDFEWHTSDDKYGSVGWMARRVPLPNGNGHLEEKPQSPSRYEHGTPPVLPSPDDSNTPPDRKGKRKAIEILSSDDEEEDRPLSSRAHPSLALPINGHSGLALPNGPPHGPPGSSFRFPHPINAQRTPSTATPAPAERGVIDLTADSSDEEDNAEAEREDESSEPSLPYFRQPGAGSTSRVAVELNRPSPHFPLPEAGVEVPAARLNSFATNSLPSFATIPINTKPTVLSPPSAPSPSMSSTSFYQSLSPSNYQPRHRAPSLRTNYDLGYYNSNSTVAGSPYGTALSGGGHWSPSSSTLPQLQVNPGSGSAWSAREPDYSPPSPPAPVSPDSPMGFDVPSPPLPAITTPRGLKPDRPSASDWLGEDFNSTHYARSWGD